VDEFEGAVARGLGNLTGGTVLLAAVSGGADSTALLAALEALRRRGGDFLLRCLHVDHGIRPGEERRGDAEAVRLLCRNFHIPLRIVSIPPGRVTETGRRLKLGLEGAARLYRRRIWNAEARRTGAEWILPAHPGDDLLETILMRILRGAGPAGLGGMALSRGRLLRPLLPLDRAGVLRYLAERRLPYRTDSTNADLRYFRNRVRLKLIPLLNEAFPSWKKSLLLFAETQDLAAQFIGEAAREGLRWETWGREGLRAGAAAFFALAPILREEVLLQGADRLARTGEGRGAAAAFRPDPPPRTARLPRRKVVRGAVKKIPGLADLGPLRFKAEPPLVTLSRLPAAPGGEGFALLIKGPGVYKLKKLSLRVFPFLAGEPPPVREEEGFYARLPLVLRPCRGDDRIGAPGGGEGASPEGTWRREYTLIIIAEDSRGPAACIAPGKGGGLVLLRRERGRVDNCQWVTLLRGAGEG
jgi:tRNA(Ile)-lysidine synthase